MSWTGQRVITILAVHFLLGRDRNSQSSTNSIGFIRVSTEGGRVQERKRELGKMKHVGEGEEISDWSVVLQGGGSDNCGSFWG